MTIYQKKLSEIAETNFTDSTPSEIIDFLFNIGVIDNTLIKVLVIREFIKNKIKAGASKLDAMWTATENFACSYEYVRKCVYYYKDVNLYD